MRTLSILAVLAALLLVMPAPGRADEDAGTVSLRFENTPLGKVIAKIATLGDANIIVSPDLARAKITVAFDEVPWRDALEAVVRNAGGKVIEADFGILRVVVDKKARKDRVKAEKKARYYDSASVRKKYADAAKQLEDARRRLEGEVGGMATNEAIARTKAEIAELEAHTHALEKQLAEANKRITDAMNREKAREAATARRRADAARTDLLRSKRFADAKRLDEAKKLQDEVARYGNRRKRLTDVERARGLYGRSALERAEHLERAAESLKAAGMAAEAEKALHAARDLRASADARRGSAYGKANLVESVNALRQDVRALREQVAELAGLVRRLLDRRGGAGGAGGRGAR